MERMLARTEDNSMVIPTTLIPLWGVYTQRINICIYNYLN